MSCLFCRIAAGEIPANKVLETDDLVAFHDISPQAPAHVLVITKRHVPGLGAAADDDSGLLGTLMLGCRDVARALGIADSGYRVVLNTGPDAQQSVAHIHAHVVGGRHLGWPPG